jgi:hypothetical protein
MAPIVLFDKSFIEMLNLHEATIFDSLYSSVICPIFYIEVLADLSKETTGQRTVEKVVADVAVKTPILHSLPNVSHSTMCLSELLGYQIEMRGVPVIAGGRAVRRSDGKVGLVYEQSPEAKAFDRWQCQKFYELEREFASDWRKQLSAVNYSELAKLAMVALRVGGSPKTLEDAFAIAKAVLDGKGQRFRMLKAAYSFLGLDPRQWDAVLGHWKKLGGPSLREYAPFTAHCLLVDLFFHISVQKRLISPARPSNRTDVAYLYYLPFAMIFVSNDNLHKRIVPLFLNDKQRFVSGQELKTDLHKLDEHYSSLPDDEKAQGLFRIASIPPNDDGFLTTQIWKSFGLKMDWSAKPFNHNENKEANDRFVVEMEEMISAARTQQEGIFGLGELEHPDAVSIRRLVPLKRGKWRILPPGVEADSL